VGAPRVVEAALEHSHNPVFCCSLLELVLALAESALKWIRSS
jgi:hypothetical protein